MLFLLLLAIVLCVLAGWLVWRLGGDVIQALLAVAAMTIAWRFTRHRPDMTIADVFRNW